MPSMRVSTSVALRNRRRAGSFGAALVALGTQTVSVWKDARELGKKAAEIAGLLADGKKMSDVPGATTFSDGPKKVAMKALLLTPVAITKDNLGVVIDTGWIKKVEVCQGVKPGSAKVCE